MIPNAKSINLKHQRLWLLPQKAVYWQKKKMLLVADLHIGKSGHFRSNGIPVPQQVNSSNLERLDQLIEQMDPRHLIFLGDLFHSKLNEEWQQFKGWRQQYPGIEVTLVIGNHDILSKNHYHASHISVFKRLTIDPFLLVHDIETIPESVDPTTHYPLGGHIHPALQVKGKGRQKMKFPCFYFGEQAGILPAFGQFTGTAIIQPAEGDRTFLVVENQILDTSNPK
jgi:DNA ligase-associated metallophosphoesterase